MRLRRWLEGSRCILSKLLHVNIPTSPKDCVRQTAMVGFIRVSSDYKSEYKRCVLSVNQFLPIVFFLFWMLPAYGAVRLFALVLFTKKDSNLLLEEIKRLLQTLIQGLWLAGSLNDEKIWKELRTPKLLENFF